MIIRVNPARLAAAGLHQSAQNGYEVARATPLGENLNQDSQMIFLLDEDVYKETINIALGKVKKSPFLAELSDWFMSKYSVKVLNIQFGKRRGTKGNRLYIILETTEDYQKMFPLQFNEEHIAQICAEFKRIALKHQNASEAQFADMWIRVNDFSLEAKTYANRKAIIETKWHVLKRNIRVWDLLADASYGTVVFYYSENDVIKNQNNGKSRMIADDYYSILKKYDQLNYFTRENMSLKFDSKENVDKNFEGKLYFYFM